ncbi:Ankyrin repeat domain containing protein [Pandoravirus salinus]|uniref:Ankyrin repeat domain containing protein n=1 Tax=Pandoravirus salinus TaxID=1349410 RepID=S4VSU6_9VIRU|nr:ankyrin repeat domain [Pandoravirus salinus]AGO83484.1 Ankyrin repeat domain containing protein [Pandoravirus salinus]
MDGRPQQEGPAMKLDCTTRLNPVPDTNSGRAAAQDSADLVSHRHERTMEAAWETLPSELWRDVILNRLSDRDLGSCLLAAPCFHALSKGDLLRRRYAHATITGMCAAGDIVGLEYLVGRLIHTTGTPEPPISDQGRAATHGDVPGWDACLFEAAIMSRGDVIRWLARRGCLARCLPYTWRIARGAAAVAADDDTLCALAEAHLAVRGYPYRNRTRLTGEDAGNNTDGADSDAIDARPAAVRGCRHDMYLRDVQGQLRPYRVRTLDPWSDMGRRFDAIWQHDTLAERRQELVRRHHEICGDWDSEIVKEVNEEFRDAGADAIAAVIQQKADARHTWDADCAAGACWRLARALGWLPRAVFVGMIKRGMLDDAVRVALSVRLSLPEAMPWSTWEALAEAVARANRVDLMRAMGLAVSDPDTGDWAFARCDGPGEEWLPECVFSGAVAGGHVDLLDRALRAWNRTFASRDEFFFEAVASGRLDAVRWLHAHDANIGYRGRYGTRAYSASPLTVAIGQGADDIVAFLLGLSEARFLVRDAFDDAVEIGDLRTARRLYEAHGPTIDNCPPVVAILDDDSAHPLLTYRQ